MAMDEPTCPTCGAPLEWDEVDIYVGMVWGCFIVIMMILSVVISLGAAVWVWKVALS